MRVEFLGLVERRELGARVRRHFDFFEVVQVGFELFDAAETPVGLSKVNNDGVSLLIDYSSIACGLVGIEKGKTYGDGLVLRPLT